MTSLNIMKMSMTKMSSGFIDLKQQNN